MIRRVAENAAGGDLVIPSFSSRTIVYKGMLTPPQLRRYFADLRDARVTSPFALVHSRFSTNTFPSWELAHPYRLIAHNGEINTLRGNVNWMQARESQLVSHLFGDDIEKILPIVRPGGSDTAVFDNVLELLVLAGRSLPHALMMMVPEAYRGPPGRVGGAARLLRLPRVPDRSVGRPGGDRVHRRPRDRRDARPQRAPARPLAGDPRRLGGARLRGGRPRLPPADVLRKGRLQPGKLFLVDLERGRIVPDHELKQQIATQRPYAEWFAREHVSLGDLPSRPALRPRAEPLRRLQLAFGYTQEDMKVMLAPLAVNAEEAIGSMGNDTPLAALSNRRPLLYSYFKQLFAQVTNPPIDSTREAVVMSVGSLVGSERNLLDETPEHARQLVIENPILRDDQLESLRQVDSELFKAQTLDITWPVDDGVAGLESALERLCADADRALAAGTNILVLSDRAVGAERAPIPSLLAVGAVHHHLVRTGTRLQTGLVVESGEPRSVQSVAVLIGYGAAAVNPYLMLDTIGQLVDEGGSSSPAGGPGPRGQGDRQGPPQGDLEDGHLDDLLLLRCAGLRSGRARPGADRALLHRHAVADRWDRSHEIAEGALVRHRRAFPDDAREDLLPVVGLYAWRRDGEHHQWNPETIALLQHAVRGGGQQTYDEFAAAVNDDAARRSTLRGLLRFRTPAAGIPLAEVEPAAQIVKRFSTGAMSLGSLSREAHETLAVAMNRIGGRSNTGEGGEDPVRFTDERRSKIKQVASGRFGVNIDYLTNADELQIKMAQGAKPGEGGQLPGPQGRPVHRGCPADDARRRPDLAAAAP